MFLKIIQLIILSFNMNEEIEKYKEIQSHVHYLLINKNEDFDRYALKYQKINNGKRQQDTFIFNCMVYCFNKGLDYKLFYNKNYSNSLILKIINILDKKLFLHEQNNKINLALIES